MSKISIKIVEVDQATQNVLVKYASESSKKNIDDYDAVAFQLTNYSAKTLEEFIEAIRPQITQYTQQRDAAENFNNIDISSWHGHVSEVEAHVVEISTPAAPAVSPINAFVNAEVIL